MRTAVSTTAFLSPCKLLVEKVDDNANKLSFFCPFKYRASVAWAPGAGYF